METNNLIIAINKIFIDVLDDTSIVITPETTSEDVDGWDSLTHIQLIVAIEKYFKVRFSTSEIYAWKNVEAMCKTIQEKCPQYAT